MLTGPFSSALCGHAAPRVLKRGQEKSVITTCLSQYSGPPPAWPGRAVIKEHSDKVKLPKKFSLLGSTGSIGTQSLEIIQEHPEQFELVALGADAVITGIVGCAGLQPTCRAIEAGKDICLANKETLIAGAPYVLPLAQKHGVHILPADSEHSAIFQCIQGLPENGLRRIILTASGGAFRDWPVEKMKTIKVADALKHPNWSMGRKITVDSATLMNKGLEVIEAHYLFGVDYDNIDIVIHPQSIIHSMVETQDSSVLAQLGWPSMRIPILVTMSWPERLPCSDQFCPRLDFVKMGDLTFKAPDDAKYPAMQLAYSAGRSGGTMTGVLSAANEQAVEMFLDEKIGYMDIVKTVEKCCDAHVQELLLKPSLDEIVHFDQWARDWRVTSYRQHATRLEVAGDLTRYRERKLTNSLSLVGWIQV
ncbi:hypothetical protein WJX82_008416 [Trebouxia sp. C0006]